MKSMVLQMLIEGENRQYLDGLMESNRPTFEKLRIGNARNSHKYGSAEYFDHTGS